MLNVNEPVKIHEARNDATIVAQSASETISPCSGNHLPIVLYKVRFREKYVYSSLGNSMRSSFNRGGTPRVVPYVAIQSKLSELKPILQSYDRAHTRDPSTS
jgi:hypothetical protein